MLRIDQEQKRTLDRRHRDVFVERVVVHLRKHHAEHVALASTDSLDAYVLTCIDRARTRYGLETEQAVVCYCQLSFLLGAGFETAPGLGAIPALLNQRTFDPSTRAKMALAIAYRVRGARG